MAGASISSKLLAATLSYQIALRHVAFARGADCGRGGSVRPSTCRPKKIMHCLRGAPSEGGMP
jgi:hypothetical protein